MCTVEGEYSGSQDIKGSGTLFCCSAMLSVRLLTCNSRCLIYVGHLSLNFSHKKQEQSSAGRKLSLSLSCFSEFEHSA